MMMHKNKIQHSFDRAANSYDDHSHVQKNAGIKLIHLLKSHQTEAKRLLDLGCGTGVTTQFLAKKYQYLAFHAIDISQGLLNKANQRLENTGIHIHNMDFDSLGKFTTQFDIIYSNMALQWSTNLLSLLTNTHALLNENGVLAFSIPLAGTFTELQTHCAINHFNDSETITNMLKQSGFDVLTCETENITLAFNHAIQALQSIKHIGANHVTHRTHKGLSAKSNFKQINANQLTYVIGYFIARRKQICN